MDEDNLLDEQSNFDIAIIGMSGKFPGANNIEEFWRNLCSGVESVSNLTNEELLEAGVDPEEMKDPNYVKVAAPVDRPEWFDAKFFGYSPKEATVMDPQHRLFLECAWETLENAGYDPDRYEGPIGVYAGTSRNTYILFSGLLGTLQESDLETVIGSDKDFLTTRVSYKLNLKGPSVTVQSGCSTSLVAIHMACQSLLNAECDMVLAGGVSIRVPQKKGYIYRQGGIPSPDGRCRAFDENAQGTVFGSGLGVVLLKRLDDAIADGDYIHAVIKGTAINNDGNAKVGYTAPSIDGQSKVIEQAMANADVEPDTITYVEAHGTGTSLGDPIEIAALKNAYLNRTEKKGYCAIGSVKTNIGHLDAAAGVTGFIKTVLALEAGKIPPSLNYHKPNPEIDFENSPFYVNTGLKEWKPEGMPRRAGVSSFGVGGTNAHVILEEAPDTGASGKSRPWQLLPLSAKTPDALETATANLAGFLKNNQHLDLSDIAYTLQKGRQVFGQRRMIVCRNIDDAVSGLESLDPKKVITSFDESVNRDVVFIFSGQGSQYVNMGLELYRTEPTFREEVDLCSEILKPLLGFDIRNVIYPDEENTEEATARLTQTCITQPALFIIEYALAKLWMEWGVIPKAFIGHSIGEYTAACLAGVFTLEDALALVVARGRLIQDLPGGSMLAVFLPEEEVQSLLGENLALGVVNGPSLCVVSGENEDVQDLEQRLKEKKVGCRYLHTSHAFHSKMMDPILDAFSERVKQLFLNTPSIPFVSNVTGTWIRHDEATDPDYWVRHLRHTVRFNDCLNELLDEPNRVVLEVGPGSTFSTLAGQHPSRVKEQVVLSSTRHPKDGKSDVAFILNTLGQLWMAGVQIDWSGFYKNETRRRLPLPTYPFERQRYWAVSKPDIAPCPAPDSYNDYDDINLQDTKPEEQAKTSVDDRLRDDVESALAEIWHETLGVKQVNYNDNFFDLGGNSLIAVRMFAEIEKIFEKRLPLATLIGAPTIEKMAAVLRDGIYNDSMTSLVPIQSGDSRPPIFFVHAAGGNLLIYRDLVRHLGPDQTVYGLQAQGLDGELPFHTSIEEMAAHYIREIQSIQPDGPYLLAGYCLGGSIALEMAQQLRARDKEIGLLVLLETYNFSKVDNSLSSRIHHRMQQIEFHARNLFLSENKMTFFQEKAKVAWGRKNVWFGSLASKLGLSSRIGNGRNSVLSNFWELSEQAAVDYIPREYPGRITEFLPKVNYASFDGPELGWEKIARDGLETHILPVYPRGMLVAPFVKMLAEQLKDCIARSVNNAHKQEERSEITYP